MNLELKNVSHTNILYNISFNVELGKHLSIIGGVASGKSTLCNILNNRLKFDGE